MEQYFGHEVITNAACFELMKIGKMCIKHVGTFGSTNLYLTVIANSLLKWMQGEFLIIFEMLMCFSLSHVQLDFNLALF